MTARCLDYPISADFFSADDLYGIASMDNFFDGSERQLTGFPSMTIGVIVTIRSYIECAVS